MRDVLDPVWLSARIVEGCGDAVVFADRDGVIRLWNRGAETIFGWAATEAIGRTVDLIIPEKLQQRHWDGYHKVMQIGMTRYGRDVLAVPAMHMDGSRRSIEFTVVLVRDEGESVLGIGAILRDVTARFACRRLVAIPGLGRISATTAIGNGRAFSKGRDFGAWLGLVPRQRSTGGKPRLLGGVSRGTPTCVA